MQSILGSKHRLPIFILIMVVCKIIEIFFKERSAVSKVASSPQNIRLSSNNPSLSSLHLYFNA